MKKQYWPLLGIVILMLAFAGCSKKEDVNTAAGEAGDASAAAQGGTDDGSGIETQTGDIISIDLSRVHFQFDQATLTSEAKRILRNNTEQLKSNANARVVIEGHCDNRGSVEYNLALGQRRADSIKNYLLQLGVSPDRLDTLSYGEERPLMDGDNEASWAKNRRGEFVASQ